MLLDTIALEAAEIAGLRSLWNAAPADLAARHRIAHTDVDGAHCATVATLPGMRLVNHVLGFTGADGALERVERFVAGDDEDGGIYVAVRDGTSVERMLAARGYAREDGWVKFARRATPAGRVECPLQVRPVTPDDAERMGRLLTASFDLPGELSAWFGALVGRRGWHCLGAYDGDRLVATGSLFASADTAWLTWGATDAAHRGRRAQKALLAARIELAAELGLQWVVTETGERGPGRADASYRNILAAGFEPMYRRPFWRAPSAATSGAARTMALSASRS